jgi:hypothetical protein
MAPRSHGYWRLLLSDSDLPGPLQGTEGELMEKSMRLSLLEVDPSGKRAEEVGTATVDLAAHKTSDQGWQPVASVAFLLAQAVACALPCGALAALQNCTE